MRRVIKRPISGLRSEVTFQPTDEIAEINTPEEVVRYCTQKGLVDGNTLDVEALIRSHPCLTLVFKDLGTDDAYIMRVDEGRYEIGVNRNHSRTRQRFSMAHELAHYLLHRDRIEDTEVGEKILYRNARRNPIEAQANAFAAETLMSEEHFRDTMKRNHGNLIRMASDLTVSLEALKYRAQNLGYTIND